ncbi:unnamed protein product [Allacma fusca]|uniref:rRNA methyltransferase 2, mitochondrial n=1 Tax=Allacma fusca TaxID=39272 RepID=A0A8J2LQP4_9HEXA|nr:unnamed protein product [Allacma fusca]
MRALFLWGARPGNRIGIRGIETTIRTGLFHTTGTSRVIPDNLKGKSTSSQHWMTRHLNDPYVAKAIKMGYRARSAFKLTELNSKFNLLCPGQWIVDCGAAPGAWTQVCVPRINSDGKQLKQPKGKIISIDLLPIEPIPGAILLPNYDFTHEKAREKILETMRAVQAEEVEEGEIPPSQLFDGVLSDMAPNATGFSEADHYRILSLVKLAIEFAQENARKKSFFVAKLWDGPDTQSVVQDLEQLYKMLIVRSKIKQQPSNNKCQDSEAFYVDTKNPQFFKNMHISEEAKCTRCYSINSKRRGFLVVSVFTRVPKVLDTFTISFIYFLTRSSRIVTVVPYPLIKFGRVVN